MSDFGKKLLQSSTEALEIAEGKRDTPKILRIGNQTEHCFPPEHVRNGKELN